LGTNAPVVKRISLLASDQSFQVRVLAGAHEQNENRQFLGIAGFRFRDRKASVSARVQGGAMLPFYKERKLRARAGGS